MKVANISPNKYLKFVLMHAAISFSMILTFMLMFHSKPIGILLHLSVSFGFHMFLLLLILLLNQNHHARRNVLVRIFVSLLLALFFASQYLAYLLAFLGKEYNSRIFTLELFLAYIRYLDDFIQSISINPLLVYFGLLGLPFIIFVSCIAYSKIVYDVISSGAQAVYIRILGYRFRSLTLLSTLVLFLSSFFFFFAYHEKISRRFYEAEEPFYTVFFEEPINGRYLIIDEKDLRVRNAYPKNLVFEKKNIVIIVVDALRSDHMSTYGYHRNTTPFIDSLYSTGFLSKVGPTFSVASASFPGVNSILRSRIWANIGYNNFSLQQLLLDQGYKINFFISGDHTHFYGLKSFYGKNSDFNYYIDASISKHFALNDDRILFEGLSDIPHSEKAPMFFYFHMNSAHELGIRLEGNIKFLPAKSMSSDVREYVNDYDNGVVQADNYIKKIFNLLNKKGYLKNSIVVITADHGQSLGENEIFGHTKNVRTEEILVPLLIWDEQGNRFQNPSFATSLDIAPTIVDRLGLPVPASWEGISLMRNSSREFSYFQMNEHYSILYHKKDVMLKYHFNIKTKVEELYELSADLYEKNDMIQIADKELLKVFRKKLEMFNIDYFGVNEVKK